MRSCDGWGGVCICVEHCAPWFFSGLSNYDGGWCVEHCAPRLRLKLV